MEQIKKIPTQAKIAMIQMEVKPGDVYANINTAKAYVAKAAKQGANIALLPECMDFGWTDSSAIGLAEPLYGNVHRALNDMAVENNIYIVAGIVEREGERLYNTALLISPKGELLGKHRKISLVCGVEDIVYSKGDKLELFKTEFGNIALTICADNLMPSICFAESLAIMGAKLFLSPCSWAVPPDKLGKPYGQEWIEPYTYLTKKYNVSILGLSNVGEVKTGPWKNWQCIGNSIAMGAGGKKLAVLPYGDEAMELIIL